MKNQREILTQKKLKELLTYNPDTGIFTRKIILKKGCVGEVAGYLHKTGYIRICVDGVHYKAHRIAWFYMYGVWPRNLDHEDQNKSNNRINNLLEKTHKENAKNAKLSTANKSGVTGVRWHKRDKLWAAEIRVNGVSIYLGGYKEKERAIKRRQFANVLYGFHENHGRKAC